MTPAQTRESGVVTIRGDPFGYRFHSQRHVVSSLERGASYITLLREFRQDLRGNSPHNSIFEIKVLFDGQVPALLVCEPMCRLSFANENFRQRST